MAKLKENIEKLKEEGDVVDTEDKVWYYCDVVLQFWTVFDKFSFELTSSRKY